MEWTRPGEDPSVIHQDIKRPLLPFDCIDCRLGLLLGSHIQFDILPALKREAFSSILRNVSWISGACVYGRA